MPRELRNIQLTEGDSNYLTKGGPCSGACPTCLTPQDCAQAAFEVLQEIVDSCETVLPTWANGDYMISVGLHAVAANAKQNAATWLKKPLLCVLPVSIIKSGSSKVQGGYLAVLDEVACFSCCTKYMCIIKQLKKLNIASLWNPDGWANAPIKSLADWIKVTHNFIGYVNVKPV